MASILALLQSESGRRLGTAILICLSALAQGGVIPLDYAVPGLGITTGQLLGYLGVGTAALSGSNTRR